MANTEELTADNRFAFIWFFGALIVGIFLTMKFSAIDRAFYDGEIKILDEGKFHENRLAGTTLSSERIDPRQLSSYANAVENLQRNSRK